MLGAFWTVIQSTQKLQYIPTESPDFHGSISSKFMVLKSNFNQCQDNCHNSQVTIQVGR